MLQSLRLAVLLATLGLVLGGTHTPAADDKDWVTLFNGKDLDNWVIKGGKANYKIEGDAIVGTSVPNTSNTFLCTKKNYSDFILELEFKVHNELNSGVQIRSECFDADKEIEVEGKKMKIPAGRVHGYQVEIDPSERSFSAAVYDEGRRGRFLADLKDNEAARKAFKKGDWNKFKIECKGDSIKTWINGVPAVDFKDKVTASGFIALQVHGVGKREDPLDVRWKNIKIKELK